MAGLLEIENLGIGYDIEHPVLHGVSLEVHRAEIVGLVGESGCGKTTLIRSVVNLLPPNARMISGHIMFNGMNLKSFDQEQWRSLRGAEIAMIFQNPASFLNPIMKVGNQFISMLRNHQSLKIKDARAKAVEALLKMQLKDTHRIMNAYPFQLSGGMVQRVMIGMAMAMKPKLILADEPTSALDVKTQSLIMDQLITLRNMTGTSIIIVTHDLGCAAYTADRIAVMNHGEIVECDSTTTVLEKPQAKATRQLLASIPKLKANDHD